jgi:hypothetical protein
VYVPVNLSTSQIDFAPGLTPANLELSGAQLRLYRPIFSSLFDPPRRGTMMTGPSLNTMISDPSLDQTGHARNWPSSTWSGWPPLRSCTISDAALPSMLVRTYARNFPSAEIAG